MQKYKVYGDEIRFTYCPICGKEKDNPDFSVNYTTGQYCCQSSGKGGLIDELDFKKEVWEVCKHEGLKLKLHSFNQFFREHYRPFNQKWREYLASRGIKSNCYQSVCCMDNSYRMMLPVPGDNQKIVGIKYRTMDKKLTAETGSQYDYLLNWPQIKSFGELLIVEGEIDLLSVLEVGYPFVVSLAGGAGNTKFLKTQKEWLSQFTKIIIATDNDEQGERCKKKIIASLMGIVPLFAVNYGKYKDFNDVLVYEGPKTVLQIIKNATAVKLPVKSVNEDFFEQNNCYFQRVSKNTVEQATDFTLTITGYSNNKVKGVAHFADGREKDFKCNRDELLTAKEIAKNLGGLFTGRAPTIIRWWNWLYTTQKPPLLKEIDYYGIVDEGYYTPQSDVVCDKNDLEIVDNSQLAPLTSENLEWLKQNLIHMRSDSIQSLIGITWALGRLHMVDRPYPILEVSGTTSIGKTEYVELICKMLQGTKANIKNYSTMTNHQIRTLSSSSNITPLAIDEIKISSKLLAEKALYLYSAMRTLYDNKQFDLGNTTNKLDVFLARTPLIVSGESELSDNSIKNRMVSVALTLNNKTSWEIYKKFKNTDILERFGTLAIKDRLENGEIKLDRLYCQGLLPQVKDDRQFYNMCCLIKGLHALKRILGDVVSETVENDFYKYLSNDSKGNIVIETFEALLDLVVDGDGGGGDFAPGINSFYICDENEHSANFHRLYTRIKQEHANANSTLELIDERALKKQLKEVGYIVKDRISKKINGRTEKWTQFRLKKGFSETHELTII